jgi:hypothetical protein
LWRESSHESPKLWDSFFFWRFRMITWLFLCRWAHHCLSAFNLARWALVCNCFTL